MRVKTFFLIFFLLSNLFAFSNEENEPRSFWDQLYKETEKIRNNSRITSEERIDQLLELSEKIDKEASTKEEIGIYSNLLILIGRTYVNIASYELGLEYYIKALKNYESADSEVGVYRSCFSIANVFYQINDYERAIYYANKGLKSVKKADDNSKAIYYRQKKLYNIIGLIYFDQEIDDSAEYYFNKAIETLDQDSTFDESEYLILYDNLAQLYEYTDRPNQAKSNYEKSLEVYLKDSSYYDIAWNTHRLANVYNEIGDSAKALEYLEKAKLAAEKMSYLDVKRDVYKTGLMLYADYKITDSLSSTLKKYLELNDSLIEAKTSKNIQEMETRYQVAEKEAALQMSLEKSTRLNTELENQRLWVTVMLVSLVGLGVLTVFIFYHLRQKRKLAELELNIKERQLDEMMQSQESKAYAAMLRGQDQERERIAQDLHDRLGGTLAALKMSLRKKGNKVSKEEMGIVDEAVQEVRDIAHNLSSGLMQKYGLNQALQQLKNTVEKSGGLKFQVFLHPKISVLGQGVAVELYRIVQELVNNTIKHAGATEVNLQTNFDGDVFNMIYEDNGKGFDPKKVKDGIGLENIKARVKRMNGTLHIDAEKGRGAIFIIELNRGSK